MRKLSPIHATECYVLLPFHGALGCSRLFGILNTSRHTLLRWNPLHEVIRGGAQSQFQIILWLPGSLTYQGRDVRDFAQFHESVRVQYPP